MVRPITFDWLIDESDRSRLGRLVAVENSAAATRRFDSGREHGYNLEF